MIINKDEVPDYLYKYKAFEIEKKEHLKEVLHNNQIWFSDPNELNDPFELRPIVDIGKPGGERKQLKDWVKDSFRKRGVGWGQAEKETKKVMQKLIDDPELLRNLYLKQLRNVGVYCLTEDPTNILMWAYYGNGHKGYCLQFKPSEDTHFCEHLFKVHYSTSYPLIKPWTRNFDETGEQSLCVKSIEWEHECEWRLFQRGCGHNEFPPQILVGIIIGCKMNPTHQDLIKQWCNERKPSINVSFTDIDKKEYIVHIVD